MPGLGATEHENAARATFLVKFVQFVAIFERGVEHVDSNR